MTQDIGQRGRELFDSGGYCCAESVLLALAEHQGIESDLVPKIATAFCGGIVHTCNICGAVTGAIMGIGLANGRSQPSDDRSANTAATQSFLAAFQEKFGSINCFELTNCDLGTPEGQARFKAENIKADCLDYVEQAARMAATFIDKSQA